MIVIGKHEGNIIKFEYKNKKWVVGVAGSVIDDLAWRCNDMWKLVGDEILYVRFRGYCNSGVKIEVLKEVILDEEV